MNRWKQMQAPGRKGSPAYHALVNQVAPIVIKSLATTHPGMDLTLLHQHVINAADSAWLRG